MVKMIGAKTRPEESVVEHDTIFTIPNAVTILRFLLAPVFSIMILWANNYNAALVLLVLFGATDWVDGHLARRLDQVSRWGKVLDPLADRISLIIIFATFVIVGIIPWFVMVVIGGVDATLALMSLISKASSSLEVTLIGKTRTALLMIGIVLLLMVQGIWVNNNAITIFSYGIFYAGCIGHVWAGIGYFLTLLRRMATSGNGNDTVRS